MTATNDINNLTLEIPGNIRMKKIKYAGDPLKVTIKYQRLNKIGEWDDHEMETKTEPHPDFIRSLNAMGNHLQDMCEQYTATGDPAPCDARSVTVTWSGDPEIMGCVISGGRSLDWSYQPLNINTPHKTAESHSEHEDEMQLLTTECVEDLEKLMQEAWSFIQGKRAQGDLFKSNEGTTMKRYG